MKCFRLICLILCMILLAGCTSAPVTATGFAMDTVLRVTLYKGGSQAAANAALTVADEVEARLSRHREDSDIALLNEEGQAALDADTAALLSLAFEINEASNGAFDIRLGAVSDLWNFTDASPDIPAEEAVAEALACASEARLSVEGNEATLEGQGVLLDLGAIAKGYAGDRMADALRAKGVEAALLNLGGMIIAIGDNEGQPWRVAVEDPRNTSTLLCVLDVRDAAVSTSSDEQRYFLKEGQRWHHILDPKTGYPARSGLRSVTVIHEEGAVADALSTACFVLGYEASLPLLKTYGAEAVFVTDEGAILHTDAAPLRD